MKIQKFKIQKAKFKNELQNSKIAHTRTRASAHPLAPASPTPPRSTVGRPQSLPRGVGAFGSYGAAGQGWGRARLAQNGVESRGKRGEKDFLFFCLSQGGFSPIYRAWRQTCFSCWQLQMQLGAHTTLGPFGHCLGESFAWLAMDWG